MTHSAITTDLHKTLDVERDFAVKVAFYHDVMLDISSEGVFLLLGEVLDANVGLTPVACKILFAMGLPMP